MPQPSKNRNSHSKVQTNLSIRIRRWVLLSCLSIMGLFGFFGLFGKNGLLEILRLKNMHSQITSENELLLQEKHSLEQEIARLHDPKYLEYKAREDLGMIKENEYFILLDGMSKKETN